MRRRESEGHPWPPRLTRASAQPRCASPAGLASCEPVAQRTPMVSLPAALQESGYYRRLVHFHGAAAEATAVVVELHVRMRGQE